MQKLARFSATASTGAFPEGCTAISALVFQEFAYGTFHVTTPAAVLTPWEPTGSLRLALAGRALDDHIRLRMRRASASSAGALHNWLTGLLLSVSQLEGPIEGSAEARCSENCSWSNPQSSTSDSSKSLILLRQFPGGHLPWAQGVGRSNRPAPTNLLINLQESLVTHLAFCDADCDVTFLGVLLDGIVNGLR